MKIIALESSAVTASVAVCEDEVLLAQAFQNSGLTHSVTLMPMAADLLKNAGLTLDDMDVVAVAAGPGSFTGIRIGAAAVKGFGWALDKPCAGVSSLLAMAWDAEEDGVICCSLRARQGESYYALFRREQGRVVRLTEDAVGSDAQLEQAAREQGCTIFLRDCCAASGAAKAAWEMACGGTLQTCHEIIPAYLRMTQAERMRKERMGS